MKKYALFTALAALALCGCGGSQNVKTESDDKQPVAPSSIVQHTDEAVSQAPADMAGNSADKFTVLSASEICKRFGISEPPEQIAGFQEAEEPAAVGRDYDELLCSYLNSIGKLTVSICQMRDYDKENDDGGIRYSFNDPNIRAAYFCCGDASIMMELESDDPDAEQILKTAAEELKTVLSL